MIRTTFSLMILYFTIQQYAIGQKYKLNECISKAMSNSSYTKLRPIINDELTQKDKVNALNNLPKIALNGAATYQTDVTSLPIKLPNINVPSPQKDQYKVTLDVQQNLYDGGLSKANKKANAMAYAVDLAQIDNDNFNLQEQVTNLFYTIALAQKQYNNIGYLETQLQNKITRAENNLSQGMASKSDVLQIKSSLLELKQQKSDLLHNMHGSIDALSIWIGEALTTDFSPIGVDEISLSLDAKIQRPELKLIDAKKAALMANKSMIDAKYAPKLSIFATGGYGRPGLNFLSNSFDFYGIGGLNLKVPLEQFVLSSNGKEKALLDIQANKLSSQQSQFETKQYSLLALKAQEIQKLEDNIKTDNELITIKSTIKDITDSRYNEGIITATEYTDALQAELVAKNNLALHQVQLSMAKTQYNQIKGIN
jgi:outer membrane protein TolC